MDLSAWILTMTLARNDIRTVAVFDDEAACVQAGEAWYRSAVEYSVRSNKPRPKGWICMQTQRRPVETST